MINLRFHIVSIVAVFLALAVGIFAGSTLLDKATVQVIESNQASLDAKNKALRTENDTLRDLVERVDAHTREFGDDALDPLVGRQLRNDPVLVLAARGIDERGLAATVATLRNANASVLGIVWLDGRTDPGGTESSVTTLAGFLGLGELDLSAAARSASTAKVTQALVELLAKPLAEASAPAGGADSSTSVPTDAVLAGVVRRLVDADLVDWEPTTQDEAIPDLPSRGLRVVVVSGEGAQVGPNNLVVPLVKALAAKGGATVLGELDHQRTILAQASGSFSRGSVVDPIRSDDAADKVVTIDDLDRPFGRLALVLALADLDQRRSGAYGEAPTAQGQFPGGS